MDIVPIVIFGIGFVAWAATATRPADDHQIDALATVYRIPLSPPVIERLRVRVTMLRRWRLVGALIGVAIGLAAGMLTPLNVTIGTTLFSVAVGYGVASVGAELADARRRATPGRSVAVARRRTVRSVVGPWAGLPCLVAVMLVGALAVVNVIWRPGSEDSWAPLSTPTLVLTCTGYLVVVAGALLTLRTLVRAPEHGADAAEHVVRRASRLVAVMTVLGATWMVVGSLGVVLVQPVYGANRPDSALVSAGLLLVTLYVSLSVMMGFISTVTSLPRNRSIRRRVASFLEDRSREATT